MTTQSDTPGEGLAATDEQIEAGARALYKAFTGNNPDWEYGVDARGYRQEPYVSTVPGWKWHWAEHARIVTEAIATLRSPSVASDTAALPKDERLDANGVPCWVHNNFPAEEVYPQRSAALPFQQRVQPWMMACFGSEISNDKLERGDRPVESTRF